MKATILSFSAVKFASATIPKLVSAQELFTRFRAVSSHPMTDHLAPSRREYFVLLALSCLYLILASVVCWVLVEGIQQYLLDFFNQMDRVSFQGLR